MNESRNEAHNKVDLNRMQFFFSTKNQNITGAARIQFACSFRINKNMNVSFSCIFYVYKMTTRVNCICHINDAIYLYPIEYRKWSTYAFWGIFFHFDFR